MTILQAIILGVVQGLTEFLPISSSGHLILVPKIFGFEPGGLGFDSILHLATFLAVLGFFWPEVKRMVLGVLGRGYKVERTMAMWLVVATIPVALVGVFFGDWLDANLRNVSFVAVTMVAWGVILGAADLLSRVKQRSITSETTVGFKRSLALGLAQMLALIPGTSRSGVTMSVGLLAGLDRKTAARFSFLMSLPAVGGAGLFVLANDVQSGVPLFSPALAVGFLAALASSLFAIKFLLRFLERHSFLPFALYRILLGALLLVAL